MKLSVCSTRLLRTAAVEAKSATRVLKMAYTYGENESEVEDESEVNSQSDDPEDEDEARTRRSPAHARNQYSSRKNPGVSQQHKSNAKKHTRKENGTY